MVHGRGRNGVRPHTSGWDGFGMIVIPGAASVNNRLARGLAEVDTTHKITQTKGLGMRANVLVDSADFVSLDRDGDTMMNSVVLRIRGRVRSLSTTSLPGLNGEEAVIVFSEPKRVESSDDALEASRPADARPKVTLNTEMQSVTLIDKLSPEELVMLAAKGGTVPGYKQKADEAINRYLAGNIIESIPMSVTVIDAGDFMLVELENAQNSEFNKHDSGYDFVQGLPVDEYMISKSDVVKDVEAAPEMDVERVSRSELIAEGLLDLEDDIDKKQELAAEAIDEEQEAALATGTEDYDYVGPQGYTAESHIGDLDADAMFARDIFDAVHGGSDKQAEAPAPEPARNAPQMVAQEAAFAAAQPAASPAQDKGFVDLGDEDERPKARPDVYGDIRSYDTVQFEPENVLGQGASENVLEEEHQDDVERSQSSAKMNMANEGAKSVSDAQVSDPRFADEFDLI